MRVKMGEEIKPCPFCGGKPYHQRGAGEVRSPDAVKCLDCFAEIDTDDYAPFGAVKLWNRRPDNWVSVEERLPKEDEYVLVISIDYGWPRERTYEVKRFDHERQSWYPGGWGVGWTSHWQPLPEPPK